MSNRRGTEPNTTQATNNGSTAQNINVTDLICEGPIKGLAEGEGSLYLDDVAVEDSKFSDFAPPVSFLNGTITFSGTGVGTISSNVDISSLEFSESSSRSIRLLYKKMKGVTVASDSTNSNNTVRTITLTAASGFSFDSSWETGSQLSGNAEAVVSVSAVGVEPENGVFRVIDSNTAKLITNPSSREFPSAGSYTVVVYYYIPMTSISAAANQVTLATSPASGTYEFSIGTQLQVDDSGEAPASSSSVVRKINNLNIDFRRGDLQQPITSSIGGVGGSVAVAGSTSLVNLPELKIISQAVSTSEGIGIFDKEGLPNSDGSKTYPGSPDYSVMADGATVMPSSAFGLDTAVKIAEADEIGFTIKYPALQVINLEKGDKETAYAFYVMQIRFQQDGAYTTWKALFPSRGDYVRHFANTNAPISFDHSVNLDGYRNIVGPFENFQVRILRVTRHIGLPVRQTGTNEDDTNKKKWQLSAQASIESLRAVIKDNFIYPYSSIASVSFSSRQFSSIPKRSYLLQGKLVKIPTTYTPREYSSTGIAKYEGFWDGTFHNTPVYTDNPAWVFYDIVTNNRYGAGKWVADNEIDKFALYRIARYCDELVDDGSEYDSTKPLKVGNFYRINTAGTTTWSSVGAASNTVGTIFQATDTTISGTGVAYGVEPRFRANVFLTKATDVYKVLKDFATIFLGILYWQDSKITAVQDAPQDPVYNFTKGNVIDGAFSYESSGSRTRTNQVVVTWNDPTINYEPVPVVVEDRESIVRTGRIISQNAVAFGSTSESQAIRYGRWKLWTAQNQTEVVSFKTSLAAHYVKPGDIINVQDADRFGVAYSGRASSATSTTLTFDRNVPFNSGSTYELSTLVTAPAALNASDESVTINSVTYGIGEKVDQGYVHNGSSYVLVNLDTEERASNAFIDSSGSELLPVIWKPYSYVESHQITNPGSAVSTVTLANSATFDTTPSKHNIWTLKETSGGLNVAGSEKMYKILSIGEEAPNIFTISAVEYYIEKFTAIEEEYALGVVPSSIYVQNEPATLARPVNPRVVLATDAGNPGEELILQWDEPDVDSIVQYEVLHNIPELENPLKTDKTQIALNRVPNGSVTFKIRAVSRQGNLSSYTAISYGVYDPYGENVPRMAGGIPKGVISTAQGVIDSNNHFKFQATNTSVASITNPFITYTISGTKNISNISTGEEYYLYLDVATPSLKLLEYNSTALSDMQFYRDVATGNAALSTAWTSIGTVSVAANSNEVTGSGFNTNVKLRDVLNLQNSTSPSGGDGATVISIISDTKLLIDRTFGTAKSSITGYRSTFRPDYANDSIFAEITKTGSTISTNNFITLRSSSDDTEGTTETLDDGTIAVKDGGISVDKIAANSITADKIQANTINAREINADAINANHIVAGEITTEALAANSITANQITANSVVASLLAASTIQASHIKSNSIVATIIDATTISASDITTSTLSALTANMGDITAGTLKGGTIPDANASPSGTESGAFMDLTGGKMVFGTASKHVLFDGTDLILSGVTIDANSVVNASATPEIVIKEDGTTEATEIASLDFTTGMNVVVSGTEATISVDNTVVRTSGAQTIAGAKTFSNGIAASGGISGLTLTNGISGSNFNITGVNELQINDPGEGINFTAGSSGNMTLAIVDDASDNILRYSGTNAVFDVQGNITLSGTVDGRDLAADGNKLDNIDANANDYSLPTATSSVLGGVKIGSGINIDANGVITASTQSEENFTSTLKTKLDNIEANANNYSLPISTSSVLGGVKDGARVTIDGTGVLSADVQTANDFTDGLKLKLDNIDENANAYSLPTASTTVLGGVKIGSGITITAGTISADNQSDQNFTSTLKTKLDNIETNATADQSASEIRTLLGTATSSTSGLVKIGYTENNKNYPVELSSGKMFVNVPWTDNNTIYTAGSGLSLSGSNQFSVDSTVVRTSGAQTIAGNKTFSNNVTVTGNFTVNGTTTTINTATLTVEDNIIVVNSGQSGTPANTVTAGLEVERGDSANVRLVYAETGLGPSSNLAGWNFGNTNVTADTFYGDFIGDIIGSPSSFGTLTTDDLTEGDNNLYYLDSRVRAAISGASGGGISFTSSNGEIAVDSTVVRTSGTQTVGGAKTLTSNLTVGTTTDSTYILFPDKNVLDNPTAVGDKRKLIAMGNSGNGGLWQTTGRGGLMLASADDSLILASGDVGRSYDPDAGGYHPDPDNEEIYLLTDGSVRFMTNLQTASAYKEFIFDSSGNATIPNNIVVGGTVDGRDVATDGAKLDNIAANATNTAAPAISTNGSTPALASGITGAEVRSTIGAGTSSLALGTTSTTALRGDTAIPTVYNPAITLSAGNLGITMDSDNSFTLNQSGSETITISHGDTSSQESENNSNGSVIQDIILDTFGHITGIDSIDLDGRYFTETESDARYLRKDSYNSNWTRLGYGSSGTAYWHKLAEVTIDGSFKDYQLRCDWTDRYNHGTLNIHIHSDNDNTADVWDAYVQQFGQTNRKLSSHFKYYKSGSTVQVWIYTPGWREWDYIRTDAVTEGTPTIVWYKEGDSGAGKTTTEPSGLTEFDDYTPRHPENEGPNFYLDGVTKSGNTLTFSVNGTTDQTYTFGSNAFTSTTIPTVNNGQIDGRTSGLGLSGTMDATANQSGDTTFTVTSNATTASTASTLAYRDSAGDIHARLFRSEYDTTNASIGFIMTQIDTGSNNYIRPSTPTQVRAGLNVADGADVTPSWVPSTNPNYLTDITSSQVTTALGFTPYNATNPSGFITNSGGTTAATASTVVKRTSSADVQARLFRSNFANQATISGAMAFRVNNGADDYIRFCSDAAAIRSFIGAGTSSTTGTVTSVSGGTGLSGTVTTSGSLNLTNTGVTATSYTNANITVDAQGRITAASSGTGGGTDLTALTDMTQTITTSDEFVVLDSNAPRRKAASEVISDLSILTGSNTGELLDEILIADTINANMITAQSVVSDIIAANTITASNLSVLGQNVVNPVSTTKHIAAWGGVSEDDQTTTSVTYFSYSATEHGFRLSNLNANGTFADDVAASSDSFIVAPDKIYKVTYKAKFNNSTGIWYVGLRYGTSAFSGAAATNSLATSPTVFKRYDTDRVSGTTINNFYFVNAESKNDFTSGYSEYTHYIVGANRNIEDAPNFVDQAALDNVANGTNNALDTDFPYVKIVPAAEGDIAHVALRFLNYNSGTSVHNEMFVRDVNVTEVGTGQIVADNITAGAITAEQLQISNNSSGSAGIFMDYNGGNSRIDIRDSSALRVRIGYLA